MQADNDWETSFRSEIEQAEAARQAGNEGMARVCARRAAGIAVGEFLRRRGLPDLGPSAYERLDYLTSMAGVEAELQEIAAHLLLRVTPEHRLPIDVDLIVEARRLKRGLLGG